MNLLVLDLFARFGMPGIDDNMVVRLSRFRVRDNYKGVPRKVRLDQFFSERFELLDRMFLAVRFTPTLDDMNGLNFTPSVAKISDLFEVVCGVLGKAIEGVHPIVRAFLALNVIQNVFGVSDELDFNVRHCSAG